MAEGHHSSMWPEVTSIEESPDQCILAPWRTYHICLLLLKLSLRVDPMWRFTGGQCVTHLRPLNTDLSQTWHTCTSDLPQLILAPHCLLQPSAPGT